MKSEDIRTRNVDTALFSHVVFERRAVTIVSAMITVAFLVSFFVLPLLKMDSASAPGLLITFTTAGVSGLVARWAYDHMRPPRRYYLVAFSAPRWDSQLAEPVEVDYEDSTYFVDNSPAAQTTRVDEWVRLTLRSGVSTYILAEDLAALSSPTNAKPKG
jgi:4-amino-4-deoxy-L-arabinose transferase-like glycosyltransferase